MSKAHFIAPTVPQEAAFTARLGTTGAKFSTSDVGKLVKLAAESQYNLCAVGDQIEGIVAAVETAPSAGFSVGSIFERGAIFAIADGAQATPGTGSIAINDFVVCGTVTALGTPLAVTLGFPKVCKATFQPFAADAAALTDVNDMIRNGLFGWRVVSLGAVGTGAVGTTIVVKRVN